MLQFQREFVVTTSNQRLCDITREVQAVVAASGIMTGIAHVFVRHTSASLIINENADPDVLRDLEAFMKRLAPDGDPLFAHTMEGPDDMPAHVKTALTATSLSIPVEEGRMVLGTWQAIYVFEHRVSKHERRIVVHVIGE